MKGIYMKEEPGAKTDSREPLPARVWRLFWLTVLVGHVVLSGAWWWLEPGGFGVRHPRFWANSVAPILGLGLSIGSLAALRFESRRALRWLLPVWPAAWAGSALAGRLLFPITLGQLWLIPLSGSVVMGLASFPLWRGAGSRAWAGALGLGLCAAPAAAGLVWTQHPPLPRTRPSHSNLVEPTPAEGMRPTLDTGTIRLGPDMIVHALDGSLTVRFSPLSISVQPLLTFLSGSKDGCWSVLVRPQDRVGPEPRLRVSQREGERACALIYDFRGQGPATLRVQAEPAAGSIMVEANTKLMHTTYSHLNSYCDFEVRGHQRLSMEFSPCPGVPIEVRRFDYPVGRPARFAFVEEDRTFRVVEASSGEKGPFHTLARGRLGPEEALTLTLHDQGRTLGRISLADWSSQADTTLSPTAGWGAPVNAIEFSLSDDSPSSSASIFVTLAGTSVGRGWDCVGHNPGTYRNRIHLEIAKTVDQ
ncbi:MAG TPA: hypothetical protein VKA15_05650 [Isosphaeraceae bacterium]|nr:hypothetical protein [Isosphaeraceae bacterium]